MVGSFLKGNFKTKKEVIKKPTESRDNLEARFEKKAMSRLGGSIAFVSKKKVKWTNEED